MRAQSEILNRARPILGNLRRANMFGASTRTRIQKRILVRKIIEAALRNDFQNWQHLVAQNADGQLATWNKFFDQKLRSVFASIRNRRIDLAIISNDMHPNRR